MVEKLMWPCGWYCFISEYSILYAGRTICIRMRRTIGIPTFSYLHDSFIAVGHSTKPAIACEVKSVLIQRCLNICIFCVIAPIFIWYENEKFIYEKHNVRLQACSEICIIYLRFQDATSSQGSSAKSSQRGSRRGSDNINNLKEVSVTAPTNMPMTNEQAVSRSTQRRASRAEYVPMPTALCN